MKKTGGIFHDRFIVLDYGTADERVFLCGASSKDAGARITIIVGIIMIGIGWYKKSKNDKKVFQYIKEQKDGRII